MKVRYLRSAESYWKAHHDRIRPLLILLLIGLLSGCLGQQAGETGSGAVKTVYVAPTTLPCPGNLSQTCLLVADGVLTSWQARSQEIANFVYEPGYFYTLAVRESGGQSWTLVEVINRERARIRTVLLAPERVACASPGGTMCYLYQENTTEAWQFFSGEIGGFTFEPGYLYKITVLERADALGSATEVLWTLMQEVDKNPMAITDLDIRLQTDAQPQETAEPTAVQVAWQPVQIIPVSVRTVLPQTWQPLGDAATARAWSDGAASFINFSTVPGTDGRTVLAQMAGQQVLTSGQISEGTIGGRNWLVYTRNEGAVSLLTAVTIIGGNAYIVTLSGDPGQAELLLPILENFTLAQ